MHNLAPIDHEQDFVSKAYVDKAIEDLNLSEYAKITDLDKKVDNVPGKGLSTNDYTTADKNKLAGLENYDDTEIKDGITNLANAILALQGWYNDVGSKFSKESDGSIKMTGDFFTTGENSAGGKGSEAFDLASVLDRLAALEDNAAKNLVINFTLLSSNIGESKLQTVLNRIGFTTDVVNGLLDAKYNKVVGNGTYREVWNYTTHETASYIEIYLRKGDGNVVGEWYNLYFSKSTGKWNIIFGEI